MKQLTKEQHEDIKAWIGSRNEDSAFSFIAPAQREVFLELLSICFKRDFHPSCCDSCPDGEACESEKPVHRPVEDLIQGR